MSKQIRIAIFADSLPPSVGGVEQTYTMLAETLQKRNISFQFFSPVKPGDDIPWHDQVQGMPYVPLIVNPQYRVGLPLQNKLYKQLDEFEPTIIHVSSPSIVGMLAARYAKQYNIPAAAVYHTDFVGYLKYYKMEFLETPMWAYLRWFYTQFDLVLAPSDTTKKQIEAEGINPVNLWKRGIDTNLFHPLRAPKKSSQYPVLLYVGRLSKEKNLFFLSECYKKLNAKEKVCDMVIVGDGDERKDLERQLPDVTFTGYLKGKKLARAYASADIFTFPSGTETFGNVLLEAMASGLPVVTVNKGGARDLVKHGLTGFISSLDDIEEFTEYVRMLVVDEEKRVAYGNSASEYAKSYDWDSINGQLLEYYQSLITNV
ncbi:MAG: glycosyltransferase family 4 protein [Patescibacteria group bacterium]